MTTSAELRRTTNLVGRGAAWAPGTCGELAQGRLDGAAVMVTCPIDSGSKAIVDLSRGSGCVHGPSDAPKARKAVASTLDMLGRPDLNARLHLDSALPRSKGMASSTADVAAAIAATAAALGAPLSSRRQADLALAIEPSDGVMLPGIALFDHLGGRIARTLGPPPPMRVLVLEFAGEVDTEAFNAELRIDGSNPDEDRFCEALNLIAAGVANGDPRQIGEGATLSSQANQSVLPKPRLPDAMKLGRDAGALGVNVAHSGTVIGLLFNADAERIEWAARSARRRLPEIVAIHDCQVIDGGVVVDPAAGRSRALPTDESAARRGQSGRPDSLVRPALLTPADSDRGYSRATQQSS